MSFTAILGSLFLALALITAYLMFHFWGYPYDEVRRKSTCPQWKMNIHRAFGYGYALTYLVMMSQMVPRMWTYQVELPPRTVAHICMALIIGGVLLVKISILRWFRHLEHMMPTLGITLLISTIVLTGLSLPFALHERALASEGLLEPETEERLRLVLPESGLAASDAEVDDLVRPSSLALGRQVLLNKCTHCHDLRTVLARPRTPTDWVRTVERMAGRPTLGQTLTALDQQRVATYLMAITPGLQESARALRQLQLEREATEDAVRSVQQATTAESPAAAGAVELAEAAAVFQSKCSLCHPTSQVDRAPPRSAGEVDALLERMAGNGLSVDSTEIELLRSYLFETYAR